MTNNTNEIIGLQGITGAQGFQGAQGNIGAQGQRGIQGAQGRIGMNGAQGVQGLRGEHGLGGFIGLQGAQGTQGIQGNRGPRGYMGYIGKPGEVGIQGLQGAKGHIWVDGISLDGYNTHLFTLVNNKFQSVDGSLLTLNNGAKISLWLDENCYNYLVSNGCCITVDDNVYATENGKDKLISRPKENIPVRYTDSKSLIEIINSNNDLNTIVELVYYNESWYYAGGLIGCTKSNDNPDGPIQPEVITYTGGTGINIDSNNVINVKIATDNALQVNENGELFVSQSEIPESIEYTAGQGVEISDDNKINVKISTSEDNALGLNESGELFVPQVEIPESIEYTAGDGINIDSDSNAINVKISTTEGNTLIIDENGLFVPQPEIPEVEQYNVISSDSEEDFVKVDVTKNDESKQFELKTSIKTVLLSDDKDGLVTAQDVKSYIIWYVEKAIRDMHPNTDVVYSEVFDKLNVYNPESTDGEHEGTIGTNDIKAIEAYIDNANMGTY